MTPKEKTRFNVLHSEMEQLRAQLAKVTAQRDALLSAAREVVRWDVTDGSQIRAIRALCDAADQDKEEG